MFKYYLKVLFSSYAMNLLILMLFTGVSSSQYDQTSDSFYRSLIVAIIYLAMSHSILIMALVLYFLYDSKMLTTFSTDTKKIVTVVFPHAIFMLVLFVWFDSQFESLVIQVIVNCLIAVYSYYNLPKLASK